MKYIHEDSQIYHNPFFTWIVYNMSITGYISYPTGNTIIVKITA